MDDSRHPQPRRVPPPARSSATRPGTIARTRRNGRFRMRSKRRLSLTKSCTRGGRSEADGPDDGADCSSESTFACPATAIRSYARVLALTGRCVMSSRCCTWLLTDRSFGSTAGTVTRRTCSPHTWSSDAMPLASRYPSSHRSGPEAFAAVVRRSTCTQARRSLQARGAARHAHARTPLRSHPSPYCEARWRELLQRIRGRAGRAWSGSPISATRPCTARTSRPEATACNCATGSRTLSSSTGCLPTVRGLNQDVDRDIVDKAVAQLLRPEHQNAVDENDRVHKLLIEGVPVEHRGADGQLRTDSRAADRLRRADEQRLAGGQPVHGRRGRQEPATRRRGVRERPAAGAASS